MRDLVIGHWCLVCCLVVSFPETLFMYSTRQVTIPLVPLGYTASPLVVTKGFDLELEPSTPPCINF